MPDRRRLNKFGFAKAARVLYARAEATGPTLITSNALHGTEALPHILTIGAPDGRQSRGTAVGRLRSPLSQLLFHYYDIANVRSNAIKRLPTETSIHAAIEPFCLQV